MSAKRWSQAEVEAFVSGAGVRVYSMSMADLAVPDWMVSAATGIGRFSALEAVEMAHADDVAGVVAMALECSEVSGSTRETRARFRIDGEWYMTFMRMLNLIDQHDVGGLVVCDLVEGPVAVVDEAMELSPLAGDGDRVAWMVVNSDTLGVVSAAEGKVAAITGRTEAELIGRRAIEFMHPESVRDIAPMWLGLLKEGAGATRSSRRCFVHPDGTPLWVEWTYMNRLDGLGGGDVLALAYDITDRRAQEEALRLGNVEILRLAEESRLLAEDFRLLADEVPSAVFRCEADGRLTFRNTRWTEMFGEGDPVGYVDAVVHPDDRRHLATFFAALLADRNSEPRTRELRALADDGTLAVRCRAVADDDGTPRRIVGSVTDITTTVQLRRAAHHDALTGLLNRAAIEGLLATAVASRPERTIVIFVDLDGFKEVNDVHGHDAGDAVLKVVAERLGSVVRPGDAVARYGGDEFIMLCEATHGLAGVITQRLERALGDRIEVPGGWWEPSASIGAVGPEPGEEPASVLRRADLAMFEIKRARQADRNQDEPDRSALNAPGRLRG